MAKCGRARRSYERAADQPIAITPIESSGLQEAYDHFNRELFDGQLPDVFIISTAPCRPTLPTANGHDKKNRPV